MNTVFIAGSHTDVGKTYVTCALIEAARAARISVSAFKPVVSGLDPLDWTASDPGRLLAALGRPGSEEHLAEMSPFRFEAALSPPRAAQLEGVDLRLQALVDASMGQVAQKRHELLLIEGAGGVMSPVAEDGLCIDLMRELGLPVIIVSGSYLGAISHTLTAIDVVQTRGLQILSVVVSQSAGAGHPDLLQTAESIASYGQVNVTSIYRDQPPRWAAQLVDGLRPRS